ncbi:hypothetical protein [Paraburkholderia caribensis]|uniref:hypothetical protein n=1 Tax=Paraburkholderia caribensis TaxID=75105 RepID=UPI001F44C3B0|nr:hypothetical protein [Paraburkholderia caribensis]
MPASTAGEPTGQDSTPFALRLMPTRRCGNISTSPLMPPGTLFLSYQLTIDPVVDFTSGYHAEKWLPILEDFSCDWRGCWFNQRVEPPRRIIGDEVVAAGAKGILFRVTHVARRGQH